MRKEEKKLALFRCRIFFKASLRPVCPGQRPGHLVLKKITITSTKGRSEERLKKKLSLVR
jgi:hypothetical protein